jgi:hypothetical protein
MVALLLQEGGEVVQIRPQRPGPEPGNDTCSRKEVFEHLSLLLPDDKVEKEKDGMTRSWRVVPPEDPGFTAVSYGMEDRTYHDPVRTMIVLMCNTHEHNYV